MDCSGIQYKSSPLLCVWGGRTRDTEPLFQVTAHINLLKDYVGGLCGRLQVESSLVNLVKTFLKCEGVWDSAHIANTRP